MITKLFSKLFLQNRTSMYLDEKQAVIDPDNDYIVYVSGRFEVTYEEPSKNRKAILESEMGGENPDIVVYKKSLKCWTNGKEIKDEYKQLIFARIKTAFMFRGLPPLLVE